MREPGAPRWWAIKKLAHAGDISAQCWYKVHAKCQRAAGRCECWCHSDASGSVTATKDETT